MDGVLVIDKPVGLTSHDVVARVRKALAHKKIGHTGTLDPFATGVLPLILGKATKLAAYLLAAPKVYTATIHLGVTTDTLDSTGKVVQQLPVAELRAKLQDSDLAAVLSGFVGSSWQKPPMFSAKKIAGHKLYELARVGLVVERAPRAIQITSLKLQDYQFPQLTIEVSCSAGTYVRVLAADIGEALGVGAHLTALRRTVAHDFTLTEALTLAEVLQAPERARAQIKPLSALLKDLPTLELTRLFARLVGAGRQLTVGDLRTLDVPKFVAGELVVLTGPEALSSEILALARAKMDSNSLANQRLEFVALETERIL